jgi:hypothetical protein
LFSLGANDWLINGVDFIQLNSKVIQLNTSEESNFRVTIFNPAKSKLTPCSLIDYSTNVTVDKLPMWDPANGYHYHNPMLLVDVQTDVDPIYEFVENESVEVEGSFVEPEGSFTEYEGSSPDGTYVKRIISGLMDLLGRCG